MKRIIVFFLCLLMISGTFSTTSRANTQTNEEISYIIGFSNQIDEKAISDSGGKVKRKFKHISAVSATLTNKAFYKLQKHQNISFIEPDYKTHLLEQEIPWGVKFIGVPAVWNNGFTGNEVKIGVLDSGIDKSHPDIKVIMGQSFIDGESPFIDYNGHGTYVAGIIGALNNTIGTVGVAYDSDLYAIKIIDKNGQGNYSNLIAGIEWAIDNKLQIVNMSVGGYSSSKALQQIVDKAYASGILLISAAGNEGYNRKGTITYPAAYKSVIAVGAIDENNKRATFSSVGEDLELMAPGVNILSTIPGGYQINSGTSSAAPFITGVAALILEKKPWLKNTQVRDLMNSTATKMGDSFYYGYGIVNINETLK